MGKWKLRFVWVEDVAALVEVSHLDLKFKRGDRVRVTHGDGDITGTIQGVVNIKTASNPVYRIVGGRGHGSDVEFQAAESKLESVDTGDGHG